MAEDKDELLRHHTQIHDTLQAAISGLTDAQMTDPSIDGWSVKDHLAHLALWDDIRAAEVTRISAGHDSTWRMTGNQDDVFNAMAYELRRDLPLAQVRWELAGARQRLLTAIAAATPRGLDPALYGEASLHSGHAAEHAAWIQRWRTERGI